MSRGQSSYPNAAGKKEIRGGRNRAKGENWITLAHRDESRTEYAGPQLFLLGKGSKGGLY